MIDAATQDRIKDLLREFMDSWIAKQYEELRRTEEEGFSPSGVLAPFRDALVPGIRGLGERGFSDHQTRPCVVGGKDVLERSDVVSLSAAPRDASQVEPVVDAEVRKRGEVLLVDRVPQAQLRRNPTVEVAENVKAIGTLRRCR